MSALSRYRTLVSNVGQIYASPTEGRTQLLQKGLDEIVSAISPNAAMDWVLVKTDSERLLKVWRAKEVDVAAVAVLSQIMDILTELASSQSVSIPSPTLTVVDKITHVHALSVSDDEDSPTRVVILAPEVKKALKVEEEEEEEEVEEEVEEEEAEEEVEVEEEVEEEAEEAEEEEEAEVEEEGMEVEQVVIRGRAYWIDTNTNKLYTNIDDEVGDEVGAMVNGKPVFIA